MKITASVFVLCSVVSFGESIFGVYPKVDKVAPQSNRLNEDALYLTPYIENGQIQEGQQASLVEPLYEDVASYSGFLTVNKKYNSNIFFWFFPAEVQNETAPLVIWLQGGPGASSLFGLFEENGPLYLNSANQLEKRDYYWTKTMNVLYFDNPVGTGFSFTENEDGYARNQNHVGENLYLALQQFLDLFPQYRDNDLYVTGESYAGKYVPTLAYTIHEYNQIAHDKINLKGLAIGDGLCDPASMLHYSDYLYQIGLIDLNTKAEMKKLEDMALNLINLEQYELATDIFNQIILGDLGSAQSIFANQSGFSYYYNFIHYKDDSTFGDLDAYLNSESVRNSIHVGNLTYNGGSKVEQLLKADISKSIKPWFQVLLEHYRVVLYSGQLDIIVAYPLTLSFIQSLQWSGADDYRMAERKLWHVDGELAGFTKTVGNFTEVLVRNAGHMVPGDQPKWAYDMINRITNNVPF